MTRPEAATAAARPEAELLLLCARTRLCAEHADQIGTLIGRGVDWERLVDAALAHRVIPLVYRHLRAVGMDAVPLPVRARLETEFYANAAHQALLTTELLRLVAALERNGIAAVPFKGPGLAAKAYGDILLRMGGDLDILIHERDVRRGKEVLVSEGYRPRVELSEGEALRSGHEYGLVREDGRVVVELQWAVTQRFLSSPLDTRGLWGRVQPMVLRGTTVPSLAPADLLLLLCLHGAKHCWSRLGWICDVAELIESHPGLDWDWLLPEARRRGGRRMLLLGLRLAHELLRVSLPRAVAESLRRDRHVAALFEQVCGSLFPTIPAPPRGAAAVLLFNLRSRERWRDKLQVFHVLHPGPADGVGLPRGLSLLRYALRPLRLVRVYGLRRGVS